MEFKNLGSYHESLPLPFRLRTSLLVSFTSGMMPLVVVQFFKIHLSLFVKLLLSRYKLCNLNWLYCTHLTFYSFFFSFIFFIFFINTTIFQYISSWHHFGVCLLALFFLGTCTSQVTHFELPSVIFITSSIWSQAIRYG